MQKVGLLYIVTQLACKKVKKDLSQAFIYLDKDSDGKLSKNDLLEEYNKIIEKKDEAIKTVTEIMDNADFDRSGYLEFSGTCANIAKTFRILSGCDGQEGYTHGKEHTRYVQNFCKGNYFSHCIFHPRTITIQ